MERFIVGLEIAKFHRKICCSLESAIADTLDQSLTSTNARIICFIVENEEKEHLFQKDIEAFMGLKRSSVSLILNTMQKNDFIMRLPVPHDARLNKIVVTEKAKELYPLIVQAFDGVDKRIKQSLTAKELALLAPILQKMSDCLS